MIKSRVSLIMFIVTLSVNMLHTEHLHC